jgi:hypothetical protein
MDTSGGNARRTIHLDPGEWNRDPDLDRNNRELRNAGTGNRHSATNVRDTGHAVD